MKNISVPWLIVAAVVALLMIAGILYQVKQSNNTKPVSAEDASVMEGI